ncbi:uncharacterized protein LOC134243551 [Saccostrea cucullata]|uniref:uncharacterized protein LOC134243551 n=1 Tax=Saccostrea cuccullata TaxID=36930 RepID=UPI002ED064F0
MQIAFLLLYVFPGIFGIEFYPFRSHAGDISVSKNDDGSSPDIPIVTQFPFFNHQHDHLIVNTNGVISFLKTVSTYTPNPFPLDGDRRLVAIFWADVDTRKGGTVWYRESTNQTILERATNEVRTYFPQFFRFQATWVFIATWDNVAFFGCSPCTKRNTFQEILITNGQHSFTVFNYGQIEWTTGKFSGGDERTGLGGTPAQVGFNAGDGKVFFVVDASRTPDIVNVNHMTNIGIPGKFAFRIDAAEIGNGGCNTQGNLLISPRHGPMLGGQYLVISGPCINQDDVIQIQYSPMLTLFHCKRESNYSAICITPIFNITDDITVNVIIRDNKGQEQHHTGLYTIVNPALFKNPVKRHQPQNWNNGQQHVVSWDPHVFELKDSEHVQIHLFTIKEQLHNQLVWEKTVLHEDIPTILGTYTIGLQTDGYMAAIRITAALETDTDSPERGIWSDIFAVVPQRQKSRRFCQNWLRQEFHLSGVSSENIPPCPCTLQQALMDTARYQPDPDCNMVTKTRDGDFNCLYRADAQHCVRLRRITNAESLFTYPNGKSYMYYNSDSKKNFRPVFLSSIASSSGQEAREVCGNNTDCLFDFYVTGSREIAQATLHFTSELEDALNAAKEVIACPVLQSVNGGSWLSNSTIENATATFYCLENYSMNGTCQPKTCINGTWTNIQMCSCEMSPTTAESTHRTTPVAESSTMPTTTSKGTSTSRATTKTSFSTITRAPRTTLLTTPTLSTSTATRNRAISTSRTISPSKGTKPPPSISPTLTSIVTTTRETTTSQKFLTSTVSKTVQTTTPQKVLLTTVSKTTQTNTPQKITTTTVSKTARTTTSPNFFTTMVSKTAQTTPQKSLTTTVSKTAQTTTHQKSLTTTVSKTARTTHKTPTNPHLPQTSSMHTTAHNRVSLNPKGQNAVSTDDSSVMLKSVYNSIKMMWVSVGGGVIIIIIIVLITSFAICFKMRSKSQCVKGDESTSLSSQSSTGFRKPVGIPPLSRVSLSSETNHAYSDYNEGSRFSLPRYNVHKNSAYGYFDSDCQVVGNPAREQRGYY